MLTDPPYNRLTPFVRLLTERTVEQFLLRLFLRDEAMRSLCLISPFIDTLRGFRFSLHDLSHKIRQDHIPTFVVTRQPVEEYQLEAMAILDTNDYVEIRYNESIHAKVFVADAWRQAESFALFGSGNLTGRAIRSNLEVGMMIAAKGVGRPILDELIYWAHNRVRVLLETSLHKPIWPNLSKLCQRPHFGSGSV